MLADFVVYDGDETVTEVPSYTYNEEGEVIPTGTIVDEQYALNNEIYVISINETVESDGTLPEYIEAVEDVSGTTDIQSTVNFKMESIHVKDAKESWLAGDSEVNMKAIGSTWNHRQNGDPNSYLVDYNVLRYASSSDYKGHEIKKVSRSDINGGGAQYVINYPLNTNWKVDNFYTDPIAYTYVIFEYDAWPTGKKTAASEIVSCATCPDEGGRYNYMIFRSSNSPYGGLPENSYSNYAIYGNISGLPTNFKYLYYDGYQFTSSTLAFTTRKY